MALTDRQVINALKAGDEASRRAALQWLCHDKSLLNMARSTLLRMNAREADLDDILQEGRIAFLLSIERGHFEGKSSLNTFYIGICKKIFFKRYLPEGSSADVGELAVTGADESVEQRIIHREAWEERRKILLHLLGQLGEKCSEALTLYNRGFPMSRIASDLEYGQIQSAKNLVHKCRERFRELLLQNEAAMNIIKSRL